MNRGIGMNPQRDLKILAGLTALYNVYKAYIDYIYTGTELHATLLLTFALNLGISMFISMGILYGIYRGKNALRVLWTGFSVLGVLSAFYGFSIGAIEWIHVPYLLLAVLNIVILNRPQMRWYMDVQSEYERKIKGF